MGKRKTEKARPSRRVLYIKLIIAVLLDIADATLGRLFGFGYVSNILLTIAGVMLFGWRGLFHLVEMLDPTHQIDGFVPTLTLIALAEFRRDEEGSKKKS